MLLAELTPKWSHARGGRHLTTYLTNLLGRQETLLLQTWRSEHYDGHSGTPRDAIPRHDAQVGQV